MLFTKLEEAGEPEVKIILSPANLGQSQERVLFERALLMLDLDQLLHEVF
jgi:hypothetical protein